MWRSTTPHASTVSPTPTSPTPSVTHHLYAGDVHDEDAPPWRVLYLGPDRAGNLLEVVILERDDGSELAIHAMKMRKQYQHLLPPNQGTPHG